LTSHTQGRGDVENTDLLAFDPNDSDFPGTNATVDTVLGLIGLKAGTGAFQESPSD
jgi:hypothetical protein